MAPLACPGDLVKPPEIEVISEPCPRASAPEAVWLEAEALHEPTAKQPWREPKAVGGPEAVNCAEPLGPEVVVELELEEQPPEPPLTPD